MQTFVASLDLNVYILTIAINVYVTFGSG